jgi:hypothetical protein
MKTACGLMWTANVDRLALTSVARVVASYFGNGKAKRQKGFIVRAVLFGDVRSS